MTTRREFLRLGFGAAMAAGFGSLLRPARALANGPNAKKLVIALAYGGWDPMFVMDPKPDNPEVDLIPGDLRRFSELPIWIHDERPNVTTFFEQWASRTAVINGIALESLAHETCIDVMLTGAAGSGRTDIGSLVAQALGDSTALPYLALSAQAEMAGGEAHAGMLGDSNQLMALATPDFNWPRPGTFVADRGLDMTREERALIEGHLAGSRDAAAERFAGSSRGAKIMADVAVSSARMNALQQAARGGGMLANYDLFMSTENRWDQVAAALAEGISQVAIVQPDLYWDTHAYNSYQASQHDEFFGGLNSLMNGLQAKNILDETVVLVISEMGRTPRHNASGGKDHWAWTSAMLIDGSMNGGRAYGMTDDWMRPADETSGFHAGHVLATAARLAGADGPSWFGREAIDAILG